MDANKDGGASPAEHGQASSSVPSGNIRTEKTDAVPNRSSERQDTTDQAIVGIGGLARTLAHDIKNPLVSLRTFLQLYPTRHNDPAFCEKFVSVLGSEIERLETLATQLGQAALHPIYPVRVRLNTLVSAAGDELKAESRTRGIEISVDLAEDAWVVVDGATVRQALQNVGLNAIQAAEAGAHSEKWVRVSTTRIAAGIQISISDSGDGVPVELRERLFQPFFSTKPHGFGLGLAISRQLLSDNGGTIDANFGANGSGATFRITLPRVN
jgi:signal transduction histidine kinase